MRALLVPLAILPLALSMACSKLTEPQSEKTAGFFGSEAPPQKTPKPISRPSAGANPQAAEQEELVTASHILIGYQGAVRSQADRSKDEARKVADELLQRARKGEDFSELALAHSEDPTAKSNRGSLGTAPASTWVKPFGDAARSLQPGSISDLVETPFGFHIIKRDK